MKRLTSCLCLLIASLASADTLHLYTWADYISPEVVEKFEKQHGCEVVIDTFDSNESMYAKLKAGATGYDLVFPTAYMIQVMHAEGLLQNLDHAKLPNLPNIDTAVLAKVIDTKMEHSVPYTFAYAALAIRKDKIKDAEPSYALFDRASLAGRVTLLDDMRESIGAALKSLGHSLNTRDEAQLAAAQEVLIRWKKHLARFDNEGYKAGIDSAEFHLVHGYSGDLFQVQMENPKVEIIIPREGVTIGCDEMVIPKTAKQPALAHALINFLLDPAIAAENMEWMGYYCPNTPAKARLSADFLENPAITIPADLAAKCEVIQDLGPDLAKYSKVWDAVKAAK
ncbi:MAG: spermidine/putrescine ABC transporter substrate-binding protein [Verrucomicrobiaceae bacterium]|nr:spermidine/putrescine ABC transporter substrate-binding protein [Verrucomicrobiaceae bacterium]